MHEYDDSSDFDWYSYLPRWSRWFKYGGGKDFRTNVRRAWKNKSLLEFRRARRIIYWWNHHRNA